jgi:hypothetical protein
LNLDKEKLILNEAGFSKAGGGQNGGPGVWPLVVEASFCIDFLVTFSSRKKQLGRRGYERYKFTCIWCFKRPLDRCATVRTTTKGGSRFHLNDNDFLPEIFRRKGLNKL